MKKHRGKRNFFIICGIVVAAGLVLSAFGYATGGVAAMSKMSERYSWFQGPVNEWEYASTENGASFDSVEVSGGVDVNIHRGSATGAQLKYGKDVGTYSMDVVDGVLKVNYEYDDGRIVNLGGDNVPTLVITCGGGDNLTALTADVDWGDIEVNGVNIEKISVTSDTGDVELDNMSVGELTAKIADGDLGGENLTTGTVSAELDMGDCELSGKIMGAVTAKTNYGDIDIETTQAESEYTVTAFTDSGEISVNDKDVRNGGSEYRFGSGANVMNLNADMGDISIDFSSYDDSYHDDHDSYDDDHDYDDLYDYDD